jgi:hypothetical protein
VAEVDGGYITDDMVRAARRNKQLHVGWQPPRLVALLSCYHICSLTSTPGACALLRFPSTITSQQTTAVRHDLVLSAQQHSSMLVAVRDGTALTSTSHSAPQADCPPLRSVYVPAGP